MPNQYILPTTWDPPGALTGLLFGQVLQIFQLCLKDQDIELELAVFYHRLPDHWYKATNIIPPLTKGIDNANYYLSLTDTQWEEAKSSWMGHADERVFFHLLFHPQNPSSGAIQRLWQDLLLSPPGEERFNLQKNWCNYPVPVKNLTVAYHQNPNLANLLSYRNLIKCTGLEASLFLPNMTQDK